MHTKPKAKAVWRSLGVSIRSAFRAAGRVRTRRRILAACVAAVLFPLRMGATCENETAEAWAAALGVAWCAADQPQVGRSTLRLLTRVTADLAYLRLHGRNAANWFRPDAGRDARYDYRYSGEELAKLADAAREMARGAGELIVIQNNHFRGQALVNALQLKNLLQEDLPRAPQELVEAYPDLSVDVDVQRTRLF